MAPEPGADALFFEGDLVFGIERKAMNDLEQSWWSGHLARQMSNMLRYVDIGIIIGESDGNKPYDAMALQMMALSWQDIGVRFAYTDSSETTARMIEHIQGHYRAKKNHSTQWKRSKQIGGSGLEGLLCITTIGIQTATTLAQQYGSLLDIAKASEEELAQYVNRTKARRIAAHFHDSFTFVNNTVADQQQP